MTRPIGYYVHHHGDGHRQRALAIAAASRVPVTLIGTGLAGRTGTFPCIELPDDRLPSASFDGADGTERPAALHYAPLDHDGIRRRLATLTAWIAEARPALMVIDVSVEIAMLARLASVPTVYVRLSGHRDDRPHREAFRGAAALLAPFAATLDDARTPDAVRRRTFYAPGIVAARRAGTIAEDVVLGVVGRGGAPSDGERWAAAARAMPERRWRIVGPVSVPAAIPPNLELRGWVEDADRLIASAGVVIGAAGDGLVSSVIAAGRPFVCIPEPRPYDEQSAKAQRLEALRAAVVLPEWPDPGDWPAILARARDLDPAVPAALHENGGAARVARWLEALSGADEHSRRREA